MIQDQDIEIDEIEILWKASIKFSNITVLQYKNIKYKVMYEYAEHAKVMMMTKNREWSILCEKDELMFEFKNIFSNNQSLSDRCKSAQEQGEAFLLLAEQYIITIFGD